LRFFFLWWATNISQRLGMDIDIEVELGEDAEPDIIGSDLQVLVFIIAFDCCGWETGSRRSFG
jgi:hypothetical protein